MTEVRDRTPSSSSLPRARHDGSGIGALLLRSRLDGDEHVLRSAGIPLLLAAVMAGGPGWTTYRVQPGDTLPAIARRHGTDPHGLARLNGVGGSGELQAGVRLTVPVPPSNPASTARRRATASGLHPVERSDAPKVTYRVRDGDTVGGIAWRSGTTGRALLSANGLRSSSMVRAGQVLVLPSLALATAAAVTPRRSGRPVVHVVRSGETVRALAHRYRVPMARMLRANHLTSTTMIRPGSKLLLPGAAARTRRPPQSAAPMSVHVVRRGETVTAVARRYGAGVPAVVSLNQLGLRSIIFPGRRLLIPAGTGAAAAARRASASGTPGNPGAAFPGRSYPEAVTSAAEANRRALRQRKAPGLAQARELVSGTARRHGLDPALALAVAQVESGFDQRQVSPANAVGLMQVVPASGAWASELIGRRLDLLEAGDNVTAGVVLLAALSGTARDDSAALAGYYQGLSSVRRHGMFADTRRYVATVRTLTHRFR